MTIFIEESVNVVNTFHISMAGTYVDAVFAPFSIKMSKLWCSQVNRKKYPLKHFLLSSSFASRVARLLSLKPVNPTAFAFLFLPARHTRQAEFEIQIWPPAPGLQKASLI